MLKAVGIYACLNILDQFWIAASFVRHTWCALSVLFVMKNSCSKQLEFELVQIFLINIGLQMLLLGTHGVHYLCYFVM